MAPKPIRIFSLILLIFFSVGCSDPLDAQIAMLQDKTQQDLEKLSHKLNRGELSNARLMQEYANVVIEQRPDVRNIIAQLAQDGTSDGGMFNALQDRVREATLLDNFLSKEQQLNELENLEQALNPTLFNDALSDPLNVIADMSLGSLARVNSLSQAQLANAGEDFGFGQQLVGNPNYGNWADDGDGFSFWQWYGMYALFSNLSSPISFDRWGRHRRYSYYNDYGRYRYSSPKQRRYQNDIWQKTKKSFSTGQHYQSPYSKTRVGSSGLSNQSKQAQAAASNDFSSPNAFRQKRKKSSYSKNNSSFRNSRSSTSRGVSRGK